MNKIVTVIPNVLSANKFNGCGFHEVEIFGKCNIFGKRSTRWVKFAPIYSQRHHKLANLIGCTFWITTKFKESSQCYYLFLMVLCAGGESGEGDSDAGAQCGRPATADQETLPGPPAEGTTGKVLRLTDLINTVCHMVTITHHSVSDLIICNYF